MKRGEVVADFPPCIFRKSNAMFLCKLQGDFIVLFFVVFYFSVLCSNYTCLLTVVRYCGGEKIWSYLRFSFNTQGVN